MSVFRNHACNARCRCLNTLLTLCLQGDGGRPPRDVREKSTNKVAPVPKDRARSQSTTRKTAESPVQSSDSNPGTLARSSSKHARSHSRHQKRDVSAQRDGLTSASKPITFDVDKLSEAGTASLLHAMNGIKQETKKREDNKQAKVCTLTCRCAA